VGVIAGLAARASGARRWLRLIGDLYPHHRSHDRWHFLQRLAGAVGVSLLGSLVVATSGRVILL